jgi:phospho-N-acetylmuramoyl-pentapeptide-transferase
MLYLFIQNWLDWLDDRGLGFLRVFSYSTFRGTAAIVLSFLICLLLGPRVIRWLRAQKIADLAGFDQAEVDAIMAGKKGTPTMGGILIVSAILVTTLLLGDLRNFYVLMALVCMIWLAAVGAVDDWLKLTAGRRAGSRQGLYGWEKLLFQLGLGALLACFTYYYGILIPETHTIYFPFFKNAQINLGELDWTILGTPLTVGALIFILICTLVLTGSSNAVNLTDGLDGLASGCMAIVAFTFFIFCLIIGSSTLLVRAGEPTTLASYLYLAYIPSADEMAIIAGAMTGACLGFLWFNCNPASVFMGDTGSLALGGLIGYTAIVIRQEIILFLVGGIFVLEALSVLIQVGYFKYTRIRFGEGRRIFLMAPIHHHFQRKGWTETQTVVRFWLITAMLAAMALATVKLR